MENFTPTPQALIEHPRYAQNQETKDRICEFLQDRYSDRAVGFGWVSDSDDLYYMIKEVEDCYFHLLSKRICDYDIVTAADGTDRVVYHNVKPMDDAIDAASTYLRYNLFKSVYPEGMIATLCPGDDNFDAELPDPRESAALKYLHENGIIKDIDIVSLLLTTNAEMKFRHWSSGRLNHYSKYNKKYSLYEED